MTRSGRGVPTSCAFWRTAWLSTAAAAAALSLSLARARARSWCCSRRHRRCHAVLSAKCSGLLGLCLMMALLSRTSLDAPRADPAQYVLSSSHHPSVTGSVGAVGWCRFCVGRVCLCVCLSIYGRQRVVLEEPELRRSVDAMLQIADQGDDRDDSRK